MIVEIKGDITTTDCAVIAHGVNCQDVMGSGVAKALFEKWPKVKTSYHHQIGIDFDLGIIATNRDLLGTVQKISVERDKMVLNCFTQEHYGTTGDRFLSYDALSDCMERVFRTCCVMGKTELAIPRIGCGLAGGDWPVVKAILESIFPSDFTVKVYIKD